MMYEICENCGASLDFGEKCDCQKEEAHTEATVQTSSMLSIPTQHNYNTTKRRKCQDVY